MMVHERRKKRVALLSIFSNSMLVVFKLSVGLVIGSVSIISEGIHSGVDLLAAVIAFISVKTSTLPADKEHPFGHGKIENISGTIEALLIFVAAGWIIFEAVKRLYSMEPIEHAGWGVAVMLVSTVVNIFVSERLFLVGRQTDSVALQADAWHLRTDVYTSAGVMVSLALLWAGGKVFPGVNLDWLDPVAAIGVSLLIFKAAYDLTRQSALDLLDVQLPEEEEAQIRLLVLEQHPAVHGFHQLRTRKSGASRFVDFHIKVDPHMSVDSSHRITEILSKNIENLFPMTNVTIHTEPCDGLCAEKCLEGCLLNDELRYEVRKKRSWES